MTFSKLSPKQKAVFQWCYKTNYKSLICDGAVRSGKTICMVTSFILWAMHSFNGATFGICGKTVASAERNIIRPLRGIADITSYFKLTYSQSRHLLTVESKTKRNWFFIFGGKDESSYELLQGITLSGVFLDEVALMPASFVNQAMARCLSVEKARYWFNCNPENPSHWFYQEWILRAEERNALHLHFLMKDNPTLSEKQLKEAEAQFSGVFYDRYIQGIWCVSEGLIYPMYKDALKKPPDEKAEQYVLSIDYGTQNAFAALLWGKYGDVWHAVDGYYYSGRDTGVQKTDTEYGDDLDKWLKGLKPKGSENSREDFKFLPYGERLKTIIDPSAASFITLLRRRPNYKVIPADNAVMDGIRETATAMQTGKIKVNPKLKAWESEAEAYVWDENAAEDRPVKVNDHYMDSTRYFVKTMRIAVPKGIRTNVWNY